MKIVCLLIGELLFFILRTEAQLPILFKDEFNDNVNDWSIGSGGNYAASIENGKFVLTTLVEDKGRYYTISPYFEYSKDFSLEASFVQKSGMFDNGVGLMWGKEDNQYNTFNISSNGYYQIRSPEKKPGLNEWVKYQKVKPLGQLNQLRIEQRNAQLYYYINNDQVAITQALPLYGKGIGFVNNTQMVLEIDDFIFRHDVTINLLPSLIAALEKETLGSTINSIYDEVSPKISAKGNTLYFGRKHSHENIGGLDDKDDVWSSSLDDAIWSQATNIGNPINSAAADNLISISTDENTMIFAIVDGFGVREKTNTGWTDLKDIGIRYVNEDKFMEGCLSSDGKAMLFTIMNKDNVSYNSQKIERDVYVALKNKQGDWSLPMNLGSEVNTAEDEYSPFLSSDGKTLYFASKG